MSTSRPFAYNTGSPIAGTEQIGDLAIGFPTEGFSSTGLAWWNGPDEQLGYVVAQSVSDNSQPTPIEGVFASVGFFRSSALTESSFVNLANTLAAGATSWGPSEGDQAKTWLNSNGYWTSFESSEDIDQTDLILYINASNDSSYPGSGSTVYDLSTSGYDGTIENSGGFSYSSGSTPYFYFDNSEINQPYINWGLGASLVRTASVMSIGIFLRQLSVPFGSSGFHHSVLLSIDACDPNSARKFEIFMYNTQAGVVKNVATNIEGYFNNGQGSLMQLNKSSQNWLNQDLYLVFTTGNGNNECKFYINAVKEIQGSNFNVNANPDSTTNVLATARVNSCFDGFIGESRLYSIHVYDRILSDEEVTSNYNILKSQFNIS